jgi:branched-chain amino acid aminotransferase
MNLNGKLYNENEPLFTAQSRLVRYNDGVFASMRYTENGCTYLDTHLKRLYESAVFLQLQPFAPFKAWDEIPISFWKNEIERLILAQPNQNFRIRIYLFRTGSGLYSPTSNTAEFLITAEKIDAITPENFAKNKQQNGLTIGFSDQTRLAPHAQPEYATLKMPNAMPYILANIERQTKKLDEILLFDSKGYLVEGASSNIMCFAENTLFYTDHARKGGYAGVTQQIIIDTIAPKLGITTQKMQLHQRVLPTVEEILIVNAVQGVRFAKALEVKNEVHTYKNDIAQQIFNNFFI